MFGGFAGTIYHLRKTPPKLAVVVNMRKTEVLERHVPKPLDCIFDGDFACFDLLKKLS
jgi:hypothetical protein